MLRPRFRSLTGVVAFAFLVACTSFGGGNDEAGPIAPRDGGADGGAVDAGAAADGAVVPSSKPLTYLATRTTMGPSKTITFPPPVGVHAGDLLIAFWGLGANAPTISPPSPWEPLGVASAGDPARPRFWWLGAHVLAAGEGETSSFTFEEPSATGDMVVTVAAFRGARSNQPVAPADFERSTAFDTSGVLRHLTPPLTTTGRSKILYVFATAGVTPPPIVDGLDRIEANDALTLFLRAGFVEPQTPVPAREANFDPKVPSNRWMGVGSLAIVETE